MVTFSEWLANELKLRGMTPADLARAADKAQAVISRIMNNERDPAPDTLTAIAHALKLPPEIVFRAAGLLPEVPPITEYQEQLLHTANALTPERRTMLLEYARFLLSMKDK